MRLRGENLTNAEQAQQYYFEAEEAIVWMDEQELYMMVSDKAKVQLMPACFCVIDCDSFIFIMVLLLLLLPDPFQGMGAWRRATLQGPHQRS